MNMNMGEDISTQSTANATSSNMTGKVQENAHQMPALLPGLITNEQRDVLVTGLLTIINVFSVLGIIANSINIVIFWKLGFQETVNLSLFALAISDLCSVITLLWACVNMYPSWRNVVLPYENENVASMLGAWPHIAFTRLTGWVTAFVTFERFLCIARPLSVKAIITVNRVKVILTLLFLVNLSTLLPIYTVYSFVWTPVDNGSRSMLTMAYKADQMYVVSQVNVFNQVIFPISSFCLVFIFSIAISAKLWQKSKWRRSATNASSSETTGNTSSSNSSREVKVGKMMVAIAVIFIVCFTPTIVVFACMSEFPEFIYGGRYENTYLVVFLISFALEGFNSTINIVVYNNMSSRFSQVFAEHFARTAKS